MPGWIGESTLATRRLAGKIASYHCIGDGLAVATVDRNHRDSTLSSLGEVLSGDENIGDEHLGCSRCLTDGEGTGVIIGVVRGTICHDHLYLGCSRCRVRHRPSERIRVAREKCNLLLEVLVVVTVQPDLGLGNPTVIRRIPIDRLDAVN